MKTDLPTASFGSSQAPTDAVDKSPSASNTKIQTAPQPLFFHYLSVHPETAPEQWQTDIYIPLV